MKFFYPVVAASLSFLTACSSIPLTSIPKLARIDFMTTDLASLRVAVALPPSLAPQPRGVVLDLRYQQGADAPREEHLKLKEIGALQATLGLPPAPTETPNMRVYALVPEDAARLEQVRAEARARKGQKGSLSFGISVTEICRVSEVPSAALPMNMYVLTSETQTYTQLTSNLDLHADARMAEALKKIGPCP